MYRLIEAERDTFNGKLWYNDALEKFNRYDKRVFNPDIIWLLVKNIMITNVILRIERLDYEKPQNKNI